MNSVGRHLSGERFHRLPSIFLLQPRWRQMALRRLQPVGVLHLIHKTERMLDHVLHHSTIVNVNEQSYRVKNQCEANIRGGTQRQARRWWGALLIPPGGTRYALTRTP